MCLHVRGKKRRKQIKVWKVVKVREGKRLSPFRSCLLPSESELEVEKRLWDGTRKVHIGLHACTTKKGALALKSMFESSQKDISPGSFAFRFDIESTDQFEIIEGTTEGAYYVGVDDSNNPSMAGEKINWDI